MSNEKNGRASFFEELEAEVEGELEAERNAAMSKEDLVLADIARRILRLERDLTMPGHPAGRDARIRVERLAAFIESEKF
jgi:hypothetical protein